MAAAATADFEGVAVLVLLLRPIDEGAVRMTVGTDEGLTVGAMIMVSAVVPAVVVLVLVVAVVVSVELLAAT